MGIRAYENFINFTHKDKLKLHADVLEYRFGLSWGYQKICDKTGLGMNTVNNIIKKYSPKQTGRDVTLIIKSKI